MTAASALSDDPNHCDDHWYGYPPTGEVFPSVTTIIGGTQNKPWLAGWAAKLAVQWVVDNQHLMREMGRNEFEKLAKVEAKRAREVKADAGSYAHSVVEALILSQSHDDDTDRMPLPPIPDHLAGRYIDELPAEDFHEIVMDGFLNFVADFDPEFLAAEMTVFEPHLSVAGTLDFIARIPPLGITAAVDVKTGRHLTDVGEQLAAYRRMRECLLPMGQMGVAPATDCGMVLHLRPDYPRGYRLLEVATGDDHTAWNRFRRAVRLFHERRELRNKPGRVIYPPLPDGTQPPVQLRDLDNEGYGRALTPLIRAGLNTVADVAAMGEAGWLSVRGIGPKSVPVIAAMVADHAPHIIPAQPEPHQEVA